MNSRTMILDWKSIPTEQWQHGQYANTPCWVARLGDGMRYACYWCGNFVTTLPISLSKHTAKCKDKPLPGQREQQQPRKPFSITYHSNLKQKLTEERAKRPQIPYSVATRVDAAQAQRPRTEPEEIESWDECSSEEHAPARRTTNKEEIESYDDDDDDDLDLV